MLKQYSLKLTLCAGAMFILSACATTVDTAPELATADKAAAAVVEAPAPAPVESTTAVASDEMVCKRQAVVGSNFKRKVCMTSQQWQDLENQSRQTTGDIQRRGGAPGTTN